MNLRGPVPSDLQREILIELKPFETGTLNPVFKHQAWEIRHLFSDLCPPSVGVWPAGADRDRDCPFSH